MSRRNPFALGALVLLCAALLPTLVQGVSTTVVISEFRTRGPNGAADEFVELYNLSSSPVNIGGWLVRGSNSGGTVSTRATIPMGTMLEPGCHYLVTNSSASGGPYSGAVPGDQTFTLGITDDGGIGLTLPDGTTVVDQVGMSAGSAFKEGTTLAPLTTAGVDRGYERKPGGTAGSGQDTDNNANDFQIRAPSDPQNLASPCIGESTPPSGVGAADPSTVSPGDTTLLTVAVTPGANPTSTELEVTGNLTAIGGSAAQMFFDDGSNGDATAGDNTFSFLATVGLGTTFGTKALPVTITDAEDRTGNATITLTVLTPSTTVVISEFRTRGPSGGNDEFIELYNLSASPVSIGGWLVRGSNSAGTVSTRATIPMGTMLDAGCHYLVTNTAASGYSGSVPGNLNYTTGITDDGGIALTLPNFDIVDQVGMSAGSAFKEGTTLAPLTLSADRGYERRPGGANGSGQDTNNNAADFQLLAPSDPQNLASACVDTDSPTGVGAADPDEVEIGDTTLLTVAVTPRAEPSTGFTVTGDLSSIGGSAAQMFFDDGTNGDAAAGDDTFSFLATVASETTPGAKTLPIIIMDEQGRTGSASILLTVLPPLRAIHALQGSGTVSPFAGQLVRTTGIVTARRFNNGFFMQTPDAEVDGDPSTSEGIFVFTGGAPPADAEVGNEVSVTGTVVEFVPAADPVQPPLTEIGGGPTVTLLSTGNPLPAPMTLTAADTSPLGAIEQLERFEGMRVHVSSLTVVAPTGGFVTESSATGTSNGLFFGVLTGLERPFREPGIHTLDPLPMGSPCCIPRWDGNPERLRVDSDGQAGALPPVEVTSGAVITDMVGVLDFGFRTYTILPDPGGLTVSGIVAASPVPAPALNEFTVASFNLQRFFDDFNDPGIGDPVLTAAAFERRLSKVSLAIREVMRSPDILGVQEAEKLSTLQAIADQVNAATVAAGGSNPDYQAYLEEGNDVGGIDVGLLVKRSRVIVHDVAQEGKDATFINPVDGMPNLLNDRPPLVLRATILSPIGPDVPVTVIVNHLRSLLGVDDPADGPRVRAKRAAQAEFLADLVQQRQLADPDEHIIVVGDFNAFQFSDGYVDVLGTVKGQPTPADEVVVASPDLVDPDLTNLVETAPADQRYSFLFDGSAQVLDHVLITQNLTGRLSGLHYARLDADFPETYRSDGARPERISDHDAPVAFFFFQPIDVAIDIKPGEFPNSIKLGSSGSVPVAVFSTLEFDARTIDPTSVMLAGAEVKLKGNGTPLYSFQDVNGDGLMDLLVHVTTQALQLTDGDTKAILVGMTADGKKVRGSDTVRVIP